VSPDLAIATAALAGQPEGFQRLEQLLATLPFPDEVIQAVRQRVLVERKLAAFDGRGSLRAWLKTVAARLEVDLQRASREDSTEDRLLERLLPPSANLEHELITTEARHLMRGAVQAALERLPARHRLWVQLYYLDDMTLTAIAELHAVAPSTVMRALRGAIDELKALVRGHLVDAHRLGTASIDSLVRRGVA
jgi:RNA polymerase sigma-70 factor (ECF subfamily)